MIMGNEAHTRQSSTLIGVKQRKYAYTYEMNVNYSHGMRSFSLQFMSLLAALDVSPLLFALPAELSVRLDGDIIEIPPPCSILFGPVIDTWSNNYFIAGFVDTIVACRCSNLFFVVAIVKKDNVQLVCFLHNHENKLFSVRHNCVYSLLFTESIFMRDIFKYCFVNHFQLSCSKIKLINN